MAWLGLLIIIIFIIIAVLVGFEFPSYSVNETDCSVEICVVMSNPTADEILEFNIATQHEARSGTAGENNYYYCEIYHFFTEPGDYLETTGPGIFFLARSAVRRSCFQLFIVEDSILEDDEFLFLYLSLDTRFSQEGITIILNSTRVTILDNIGMSMEKRAMS